jgi:hypothetical protein
MRLHRVLMGALAAAAFAPGAVSPSQGKVPTVPLKAHVDMKTFMEHVLTPAATIIWRVNGSIIDANGEHDLSPKTDEDWEQIISGAATLAEATNALMIPERVRDRDWVKHAAKLAAAAVKAYRAAKDHDLKTVSEVSDQLDAICSGCHRHYGVE